MAASADIVGGRLLESTGDKEVAHAAAKSAKSIGVAGTDVSDSDDVLVLRGGFQYLTCSAAVTAGARVEPTADGKVGPKTDTAGIGLAVTTTTGAVSYTHLDVYKRQFQAGPVSPRKLTKRTRSFNGPPRSTCSIR